MGELPAYVSIVFILTTFATVAFLVYAIKFIGTERLPSRILLFVLPLWIFFQAALALGGFYENTGTFPPNLFLFGVFPAFLLIVVYFLFFRRNFIHLLPLEILTMLHVVRIPVEMVLYWLFEGGQIPEVMTFEGRNFDIISGILAPLVYAAAFTRGGVNRWLLAGYNLLGMGLLINIVATAIVSLPTPVQMLAFDQPNRAVLYFPYIWLPTIVVPIVFFAHLSSLWKLFSGRDK